jgi:hypothetical protein
MRSQDASIPHGGFQFAGSPSICQGQTGANHFQPVFRWISKANFIQIPRMTRTGKEKRKLRIVQRRRAKDRTRCHPRWRPRSNSGDPLRRDAHRGYDARSRRRNRWHRYHQAILRPLHLRSSWCSPGRSDKAGSRPPSSPGHLRAGAIYRTNSRCPGQQALGALCLRLTSSNAPNSAGCHRLRDVIG